jgi:adenylosuccinate lyase
VGLGFGYSIIALKSLIKGLGKIEPNRKFISNELNANWEILAEPIQTIMRVEGIPDAYEQLKALSRGSKLDKDCYIQFVKNLNISKTSKEKLLMLTPASYIGSAVELANAIK